MTVNAQDHKDTTTLGIMGWFVTLCIL